MAKYPFRECIQESSRSALLKYDFSCASSVRSRVPTRVPTANPVLNANGNKNNLSFRVNELLGYALISAKKVFYQDGAWHIATGESCKDRPEFGSFILKNGFNNYNDYPQLKGMKINAQLYYTPNMQVIFETAGGLDQYPLGAIDPTIDVVFRTRENPLLIPYVFIRSETYNESDARGSEPVITTGRHRGTEELCNRFNLNRNISFPADHGILMPFYKDAKKIHTYKWIEGSYNQLTNNYKCNNEIGAYVFARNYEKTTIITHSVIIIEKFQKVTGDYVYININEYKTKTNFVRDLSSLGIPIENIIIIK